MRSPPRLAIVGLGKMGLSHLAIAGGIDGAEVAAVCDSSSLLTDLVRRHCHLPVETDYRRLLARDDLDAVVIATPTRLHAPMVDAALDRGLHVFCEKPLTLSPHESERLADRAEAAGRVAMVGYHNRFVATFAEARRLIDAGAIGRVTHVMAEAYGPVVLKKAGSSWRGKAQEGGGCLFDYAAHPLNLMNWYVGRPLVCLGAALPNPFSAEVDDASYATLRFAGGVTGQLSVNWSDESARKMTTRLTLWGEQGRLNVDRQELQLFCGSGARPPEGFGPGWSVRHITDLTPPVSYYLRGEEYSAQLENFVGAIAAGTPACENDFRSAAETDHAIAMIRDAAAESLASAEAAQ